MFTLVMNVVYPSNILILALICCAVFCFTLTESRIKRSVSLNTINLILMFGLACLANTFKQEYDDYSYAAITKSYFVVLFLILFLILDRFEAFQLAAKNSIKWILILLISVFYLQFITFLITGQYLDFLSFFGIREAKPNFYLSIFGITDFVRCTSLLNEPGTYCSYLAVLIATAINCDVISQRKNKILIASALVSMILSFSGFGIVLVVLMVSAIYLDGLQKDGGKFKFKFIYVLVGLLFVTLSTMVATSYFNSRVQENGDQRSGLLFRVILVENVMSSDIKEKLFGRDFNQRSITYASDEDYSTYPEDLGLWFFWLYWYGSLLLIWFIVTLVKFLKVPPVWAVVILFSKGTGFSFLLVFACLWNLKNRGLYEN
jgi:hypothetical protein